MDDTVAAWCVLIETEDEGLYGPQFMYKDQPPEQFADHAEACQSARQHALDYLPREHGRSKGPWVYRISEAEWVVMNRGVRVSIRVAELVTTHPDGSWDGTEPAELLAAEEELRRQGS